MNRITVDMVKEAYAKSGLKPMAREWLSDDRSCGCAVAATCRWRTW